MQHKQIARHAAYKVWCNSDWLLYIEIVVASLFTMLLPCAHDVRLSLDDQADWQNVFMMLPHLPNTHCSPVHSRTQEKREEGIMPETIVTVDTYLEGFQNTLTIPPWGAVVSLG